MKILDEDEEDIEKMKCHFEAIANESQEDLIISMVLGEAHEMDK